MRFAQNLVMKHWLPFLFAFFGGASIAFSSVANTDGMQPIRGFAIDRTEVTIEQFARYVQATASVTAAEKAGGGSTSRGWGHAPTGTTRAGVNGLWDMGANAWEWTDGGNDSARPTRGGSWWYGAAQMHSSHLQTNPADTAVVYIGFRCAKNL